MGFGTDARVVSDSSRPYGLRICAMAHCIERYCPIGFGATWEFLASRRGDLRADGEALVAALDDLRDARSRREVEVRAWADLRRVEKAAGRRRPAAGTTPYAPVRWHGEEIAAAGFVLRRSRDQARSTGWGREGPPAWVFDLYDRIELGEAVDVDDALADLERSLAGSTTHEVYGRDPQAWFDARSAERLAEHLRVRLGRY